MAAALRQGEAEILSLSGRADFVAATMTDYPQARRGSWKSFDWDGVDDAISTPLCKARIFIERLHTKEQHCCHLLINARVVGDGRIDALFGQSALSFYIASTASLIHQGVDREVFSHVNGFVAE